MRLCYMLFTLSLLTVQIHGQECEEVIQVQPEIVIDSSLGHLPKILLCALATIYKHPFMTCWSLYDKFFPSSTVYRDKRGVKRIESHHSWQTVSWVLDSLMLGEFVHNLLHAYNITHRPCIKLVCSCAADDPSEPDPEEV